MQAAHRSSGCPILSSVEGQVGQAFTQSDLVKDVPAHSKGLRWGMWGSSESIDPVWVLHRLWLLSEAYSFMVSPQAVQQDTLP